MTRYVEILQHCKSLQEQNASKCKCNKHKIDLTKFDNSEKLALLSAMNTAAVNVVIIAA